jgi:hypothetical protein
MDIYSNKFKGSLLWCDDLPAGMLHLDIDATDSNIDELYESIVSETGNRDQAWNKLWDHEKIDDCYVWIPETDPQTAIDLGLGEIEWNGETGFDFPDFFTEIAKSQYVILEQYNRAYDFSVTDLNDPSYQVYAEFCELIESGSECVRFKNQGPYNPENKKIVLVQTGKTEENLTGAWNQIDFVESEKMFDLCKKIGVKYPIRWKFDREHRIDREIKKMLQNNFKEFNALIEAKTRINTKREELNNQLIELNKKLVDILRDLPAVENAAKLTAADIEDYKKELLSK